MPKGAIEELAQNHSRKELDDIAEALGLNSAEYPTKKSIAEAICRAQEKQRGGEQMGRKREAPKQEMQEKMSKGTVKEKIVAAQSAAKNMQEAASKMLEQGVAAMRENLAAFQSEVSQQKDENEQAISEFKAGIAKFQGSIKEQISETTKAISKFNSGVREIETGVRNQAKENQEAASALQKGIAEYMNETLQYIKDFYG